MSDARCNACDKTYDKTVLATCPYCDTPNGTYQEDDDDWKPGNRGNTVFLVLVSMLAGGAGVWWMVGPKMDIGADVPDRHAQAIAEFNRLNGTTHDSTSMAGSNVESLEFANTLVSTIQDRIKDVNNPPTTCQDMAVFICASHETAHVIRRWPWNHDACLSKLRAVTKKNARKEGWSDEDCRELFNEALRAMDQLVAHSKTFIGSGKLHRKAQISHIQASGNLAMAALLSQTSTGILAEAGINVAYASPSEGPIAVPPPPAPPKKKRATGVCDRLIQRCQKIQNRAVRLQRKVARKGMLNLNGKSLLEYQMQKEKLRLCYQFLGNINNVNWHLGRKNTLTKDICRMGVKTLKSMNF